jgi:hypothetical protein
VTVDTVATQTITAQRNDLSLYSETLTPPNAASVADTAFCPHSDTHRADLDELSSPTSRDVNGAIDRVIYRHLTFETKPPRHAFGHLDDREGRDLGVGDRHTALLDTLDEQILKRRAITTSSLVDSG